MTKLHAALLAVQKEAPTLPKNATNPHFKSKFTPLDTIVETMGPILGRHGLTWTTLPGYDSESGQPTLHYRLTHAESGECLAGAMPLLLSKSDPQGQGSAITYARRYAITAVLNIVADEDVDGNGVQPAEPATKAKPKKLTKAQAKSLQERLAACDPQVVELLLIQAGADELTDLTVDQGKELLAKAEAAVKAAA